MANEGEIRLKIRYVRRRLVRHAFLRVLGGLAAGLLLAAAGRLDANCVADLTPVQGQAAGPVFFPNWLKAYAAAFDVTEYGITCGAGCGAGSPPNCFTGAPAACGGIGIQINGLTIQNFGSAKSGHAGTSWDIAAVYWRTDADVAGVYHTMTAIGPDKWSWAWNGTEANPNFAALPTLRIYADISATPSDGASVRMGIPYDSTWGVGGFTDTCCCNASWADVSNPVPKTIQYVFKMADKTSAAPGDVINYTIFYGRPGAGSISNLEIVDTQPPYTHYVGGSAVPAPDTGYDPDPGPPMLLKWTFPGPLAVTGGPTGMIRFQLTVDWGNGEWIEPGSGDTSAPEGSNLWNTADGVFPNLPAATRIHTSNQTRTNVMRYLFWKVADRDLIFNCTPSTCDEMTYSIFLKNLSSTKTWWNVSIWDTVPVQVNPWVPGYGFDDPCLGWTMTPSGCAAASPGKRVAGGVTILTWDLDMPPGMTLEIRWKAQVAAAATAGGTAINKSSIMAYGRTGIVEGTGHAGAPRNFTHEALVVLRTTYVSYVSYNYTSCFDAGNNYYQIAFYPLHPSAVWQLYYLSGVCGLNTSITAPAPSVPCNVWPGAGCLVGIERRPQLYGGPGTHTVCAEPEKDFYKLVSNAPLLWEVNPNIDETNQDSIMYSPGASLSFRSKMHYTWRRQNSGAVASDHGDYMGLANVQNVATTVHLFRWNATSVSWDYYATQAIDPSSQWMTGGTPPALEGHWRFLSSDSDLIVFKGYAFEGLTDYDNFVTMAPATNGMLVAGAGNSFYAYTGRRGGWATIVVTNVGPAAANINVYQYQSLEPLNVVGSVPPILGGGAGIWTPMDNFPLAAGQAGAANPRSYTTLACDETVVGFGESFNLYRVDVVSGGPVQVRTGRGPSSRYGGFVLHGVDNSNIASPAVDNFWHSQHRGDTVNDLVAFLPADGMVVRATSEDGYTATYTSTGPDTPVAFCAITELVASCGTNYKVDLITPNGDKIIGMANATYFTERHYAAPFLSAGTHYEIYAPAVVYVGQSFWLTVVVVKLGGNTEVDYCGTSNFTSTDPGAKIEGTAMATYDFTWSSSTKCSSVPNENGVKVFVNVTMTRLGLQTIIGTDVNDGSITGLTAIMVVGADVRLDKQQKLVVAASQDTVQFRVCWSNYSSASAFTFTINDAIPMGTTYLPEAGTWMLDCGNLDDLGLSVAYSTATSTTIPPVGSFVTANPVAGTRWLRWTVPVAGVQVTGCACYRVTVN